MEQPGEDRPSVPVGNSSGGLAEETGSAEERAGRRTVGYVVAGAEEVELLVKGLGLLHYRYNILDLLRELYQGKMALVGWGDGVLVIQVLQVGDDRQLEVFMVAGRGFMKNMDAIVEFLRGEARKLGCKWISGVAMWRGLERAYLKLGAKPVGTYMVMEV